jgi:transcription elongation factor Elf1
VSLEVIKKAIADKEFRCPECNKPVTRFEKFVEMASSVWDGAGDTGVETAGSKVTLICGNEGCAWQERTEYWENYLSDDE